MPNTYKNHDGQPEGMRICPVVLPSGQRYPVYIGDDALSLVSQNAAAHVAVVSNPTVFALYGERLMEQLRTAGKRPFVVIVEDGEAHKNLHSLSLVLDAFIHNEMRRDGGIIALGGGVIGDLAGFAAAVYMRGVEVLQVPTTLLAQVDAAIGGKTGVNHADGKNMIGAFYQPKAVFCDTGVLSTQANHEYRAGLAEVVKYGLLGDADFFAYLESTAESVLARDISTVTEVVEKSVRNKAAVVVADEKESTNHRALLNLGHTFAHAIETTCGYGRWLHGEAVAIGLATAARLSKQLGHINGEQTARTCRLLERLRLPIKLPADISDDELLTAMRIDKKHTQNGMRFIVLHKIGEAAVEFVEEPTVRAVLQSLR